MSSITTKPVAARDVSMDKFSYSKVNSLPNGAKLVYMNHGEGISPLFLQTPQLTLPFDSGNFYPDAQEGSGKYSIRVSMDNMESNKQMKEFHDMLATMDEKILADGVANSQDWFKKKSLDISVARELYTPMVKVSKDSETGEPNGKWAPSFQFKIVKRDGKVLCDCYDSSKQELVTSGEDAVDLESMFKKGSKVKMILKCNGLWIASGKFGCTWRAEQIKIDAPQGFAGYAFNDSDDEDEGVELSRQDSVAPTSNYVEDSGDEEEGVVEDSSSKDDSDSDGSGEVEVKKVVKRKIKKSAE